MKIADLFQTVINSKDLYALADNIERLILSFQEIDSRYRQKLMSELYHMGLDEVADELKRMEEVSDARKELEMVTEGKLISQKMFRVI